MQRRFVTVLLALAAALCCALGLAGCDLTGSVNGTYYRYQAEQLEKSEWYELEDGTWRDAAGEEGTYELFGSSISFYGKDLYGEDVKWATGTVKDGVLTMTSIGVTHTYCIEGREPSARPAPEDAA